MIMTIILTKDRFLSLHFIEKCIVLETFFPNKSFGENTNIEYWTEKLFNGSTEIEVEY
jgi:hypothetical protein